MLEVLTQNLPTLIVLTVVVLAMALAIVVWVRKKRKGTFPCGGSCQGCPSSAFCHKKKQ